MPLRKRIKEIFKKHGVTVTSHRAGCGRHDRRGCWLDYQHSESFQQSDGGRPERPRGEAGLSASWACRPDRGLYLQHGCEGGRLPCRTHLASYFYRCCVCCRNISQKAALTGRHERQSRDSHHADDDRSFVYFMLRLRVGDNNRGLSCRVSCGLYFLLQTFGFVNRVGRVAVWGVDF